MMNNGDFAVMSFAVVFELCPVRLKEQFLLKSGIKVVEWRDSPWRWPYHVDTSRRNGKSLPAGPRRQHELKTRSQFIIPRSIGLLKVIGSLGA
jgi:hypothetical protein